MTNNENTGLTTFKRVFLAGVGIVLIAVATLTAVSCKNPVGGPEPTDPTDPTDPDPEDTEVKFNVDRAEATPGSFKFSIPNTKTGDAFTVKIGGSNASSPTDYTVNNGTFTIVGKLDANNLKDIRVQLVGSTNEGTLPGMFLYPDATKNQNTWEDLLTLANLGISALRDATDPSYDLTLQQISADAEQGLDDIANAGAASDEDIKDHFTGPANAMYTNGGTWTDGVNDAAQVILGKLSVIKGELTGQDLADFNAAYNRIYMNKTLNPTNDATIKGQVKDNTSYDINTLAMQMIPEGIRDLVEDPLQYLIAEQLVRMG